MQNIIKVKDKQIEQDIKICQGQKLLNVLQENNFAVSPVCHGNGTCGKCKVKIFSEHIPISEADRRMLSKEELEQGIRLACKVEIEKLDKLAGKEALRIETITSMEEDIVAEGLVSAENKNSIDQINGFRNKPVREHLRTEVDCERENLEKNNVVDGGVFIAVDIGTTTIAMALVDTKTGIIYDTYTSLNHQRKFGADVISRINAANHGNAMELKRLIEEDLWKGICKLMQKQYNSLKRIVIAGNTTMIHLLMGFSCQTLGKYPFSSEHLGKIECTMNDFMKYHSESFIEEDVSNSVLECENRDFFGGVNGENVAGIDGKTQVTVFPGISAFIGGDLVADLFNCPDFETKNISLLLDLGTNGEMILGNREKLLAASAAAGPALEGGNIICGTASIPGSICQVKIRNQRAVVKTINNRMPPIGICGTGLISAVSQLKQNHLLEQNGSLRFPYSQTGYPLWTYENGERIALYQQDIREFQMAKAAIRAGIEILMKEFGCKAEDISHVYLAGGFGVHLSEEDAVMTGILPVEFCGKTEFIGNGALKGAVRYGLQTDQTTDVILQRISSLLLAENENFQELFLRYLEI